MSAYVSDQLSRTFAINSKKFSERIARITRGAPPGPEGEKWIQGVIDREKKYIDFLIKQERNRIHELSREIPLHIRAANSVWPKCGAEYEERRVELDRAIIACWELHDEMQYIVDELPTDINSYTPVALKLEELINKIKRLRATDERRFGYLFVCQSRSIPGDEEFGQTGPQTPAPYFPRKNHITK